MKTAAPEAKGAGERANLLTEPAELRDAAGDLRRQAARLDQVRTDLAREMTPENFVNKWEGKVAECFLRHIGGSFRQHHLTVAHDRLMRLVRALERAADANQQQITTNRRLADEVRAELAKRGDGPGSETKLPKSLRDTSWPRVHRTVMGQMGGDTEREE